MCAPAAEATLAVVGSTAVADFMTAVLFITAVAFTTGAFR
jgi:hypothetical protein